jgi:hypothetical protein
MEVSGNRFKMTKPNNIANKALDGRVKPSKSEMKVKTAGKMPIMSMAVAENSQSKLYFRDRAFFRNKYTIIPKKQTTPVTKKIC